MSITLVPTMIRDEVSGLSISIIEGKHQNRIHVERLPEGPVVNNRDFFFAKNGEFDGTGSSMGDCAKPQSAEEEMAGNAVMEATE